MFTIDVETYQALNQTDTVLRFEGEAQCWITGPHSLTLPQAMEVARRADRELRFLGKGRHGDWNVTNFMGTRDDDVRALLAV